MRMIHHFQKGLEAGIPLQPTAQKRAAALEAIEKLAENAGEEEEAGLIRKVSNLVDAYLVLWFVGQCLLSGISKYLRINCKSNYIYN